MKRPERSYTKHLLSILRNSDDDNLIGLTCT